MKMPPYFIQAGAFKAKCLDVMDQANEKHISITITKHGKAVARLMPIDETPIACFGCLKNKITIMMISLSPFEKKINTTIQQNISGIAAISLRELGDDPTDRLITAAARIESLTLLTRDTKIWSIARKNMFLHYKRKSA